MSYKILSSNQFDKELKKLAAKYVSLKADFAELIESFKKQPVQGVPLGHDCYKIRMAIKSKSKVKVVVRE